MENLLTLVAFVVVVLVACSLIQPLEPIQFEEISERQLTCLDAVYQNSSSAKDLLATDSEWHQKEFIINDNEEYQLLLRYMRPSTWCDNFTLPPVDFSTKTLLAKNVFLSECESLRLEKEVVKDDGKKTYIYILTSETISSICTGPGEVSKNWILVPKIPKGYNVTFRVKSVRTT